MSDYIHQRHDAPGSRAVRIGVGIGYPLAVLVAVVLLAMVQVRSQGGGAFDLWRLNHLAAETLMGKDTAALPQLVKAQGEAQNFFVGASECLKLFQPDGKLRDPLTPEVKVVLDEARTSNRDPNAVLGDAGCVLHGYHQGVVNLAFAESEVKRTTADVESVRDRIKAIEADGVAHADYMALIEMAKSAWYYGWLIALPYDLLVLIMVMAMGAMGGMVRLLRDYGDKSREPPSTSDYLFIPLIGLVVAIGGYIMAKTGLLLLASGKEQTSLSPFMIGLVGLVSGLAVKEVIDTLAKTAAGLVVKKK